MQIVSGPLINKDSSPEGDINRFNAHKKLRSLNVSTSSEFDGIKNTTTIIFMCNASFLGLVAIVSVILTAMTIKPKCVWILYPAILSIVCNLPKNIIFKNRLTHEISIFQILNCIEILSMKSSNQNQCFLFLGLRFLHRCYFCYEYILCGSAICANRSLQNGKNIGTSVCIF